MNNLIEDFFGVHNELARDALTDDDQAQLNKWIRALTTGRQTAFLPRSWQGRLFWYLFTPKDRRANEILELLSAWIGPTYSDIARTRGRLDLTDPFDTRIDAGSELTVHRFEVLPRSGSPATKASRIFVRQALDRLTELLDNRPASEFRFVKSTAEILDDLGHALSTRDRSAAEIALNELSTNGDLDAINMSFVRIRTLGALGDWQEILADRAIDDILHMSRPPGVTRSIRRAVYHTYLATLDRDERDTELLSATDDLPSRYRSIAKGPTARYREELVLQVLLALRSDTPISNVSVEHLIEDADTIEIGLTSRLRRLVESSTAFSQPTVSTFVDPVDAAIELYDAGDARGALESVLRVPLTTKSGRIAVSAATDLEDEKSARLALAYIDQISDVRANLAGIKSIRRNLELLERTGDNRAPHNWESWFDLIARGVDVTTVSASTPDDFEQWAPLDFSELSARLESISDEALMVLGETSGQFLAAHREILERSGAAGGKVCRRLLEALAVSGKCSNGIQSQTLNLVDLAFSASHSTDEYSDLVEYITEIRRANSAPGTVEWQLDLVQQVTAYPHSDQKSTALILFVTSCFDDLVKYRHALSYSLITALKTACEELGIPLPETFDAAAQDKEDELYAYSHLKGRTVAIYSLMESASLRAANLLRQLVSDIDIRLFADRAGNPALAKASENVDLFVIVTAAAKHAATEFIESHRGTRPLVRVNSKGTSAILRELRRTN